MGQSELRVAQLTDIFILLLAPAAGDELQGIKRGVMELADLIFVTKCDGDLVDAAHRAVGESLAGTGLMQPRIPGWTVPVIATSALHDIGIDQATTEINRCHDVLMEVMEKVPQISVTGLLLFIVSGTLWILAFPVIFRYSRVGLILHMILRIWGITTANTKI